MDTQKKHQDPVRGLGDRSLFTGWGTRDFNVVQENLLYCICWFYGAYIPCTINTIWQVPSPKHLQDKHSSALIHHSYSHTSVLSVCVSLYSQTLTAFTLLLIAVPSVCYQYPVTVLISIPAQTLQLTSVPVLSEHSWLSTVGFLKFWRSPRNPFLYAFRPKIRLKGDTYFWRPKNKNLRPSLP